jgi:hypothetical protein
MVSGVDLIPKTRVSSRSQPIENQRRLPGSRGAFDPHRRVLSGGEIEP